MINNLLHLRMSPFKVAYHSGAYLSLHRVTGQRGTCIASLHPLADKFNK